VENINIEEMAKQFEGKKFGELVLIHIKQQPFEHLLAALQGTSEGLPSSIQSEVTELIDNANSLARKKEFWADDCGAIFRFITSRANKELQDKGIKPTDSELFDIFNIIVMNYAYSAKKDPRMKKFINSSVGKGLFDWLFGK
jgi:hypothetical protein